MFDMHPILTVIFIVFATVITRSYCVNIEVFGVGECEKTVDSDVKMDYTFKSNSPKSLDMTLDLPWNVEGDDEFHLDVHQLIDDKWTYYVKEFDGDICTYLEEFLTVAWSKLKSAADPKVEDECSLPQGKYSWTDFRLDSSDVNVPSGMIGRFKLDLSIVRDAEPVFCKSIDLETKE